MPVSCSIASTNRNNYNEVVMELTSLLLHLLHRILVGCKYYCVLPVHHCWYCVFTIVMSATCFTPVEYCLLPAHPCWLEIDGVLHVGTC